MNDCSKYEIRIAGIDDFASVNSLFVKNSERLAKISPENFEVKEQDFSLYKLIVSHSKADVLLAERNGNAVGTVLLWQTETPSYPNRISRTFTYITDIVLLEDKEELFRELFDAARKWSDERESEYMEVDIADSDEEIGRLVSDYGFTPLVRAYSFKLDNPPKPATDPFYNLSCIVDRDSQGRVNRYCSMRDIEESSES